MSQFPWLILSLFLSPNMSIIANEWPPESWTQPATAFQIEGPVYYVGGRELTSYLVVDEAGYVLVNIGMEANVPLVLASIRELGFDPQKIRYLLITQAHFDHAGGAALLQKETGAEVLAGKADVALLKSGGLGDYVFGDELPFTPVPIVRALRDGEPVRCGKLTLQTLATPGHTPGSTSWVLRVEGKDKKPTGFLFQASISVLADAVLIDNARYPGAIKDFRKTHKRLDSIQADYFLPDHLIFAKPTNVEGSPEPIAQWFKNPELLSKEIIRSRKALDRYIKNHSAAKAQEKQ